jgi:ABC-type polysaccharide/polyol phosphate export permease
MAEFLGVVFFLGVLLVEIVIVLLVAAIFVLLRKPLTSKGFGEFLTTLGGTAFFLCVIVGLVLFEKASPSVPPELLDQPLWWHKIRFLLIYLPLAGIAGGPLWLGGRSIVGERNALGQQRAQRSYALMLKTRRRLLVFLGAVIAIFIGAVIVGSPELLIALYVVPVMCFLAMPIVAMFLSASKD